MTAYEYERRAEERRAAQATQSGAATGILFVGTATMFVEPAVVLLGLGLVAGAGMTVSRGRTVNALLVAGIGCLGWYMVLYPLLQPWTALVPLIPPIPVDGLPLPISVPPPLWLQSWLLDRAAVGIAAVYASYVSKGLLEFLWDVWRRWP